LLPSVSLFFFFSMLRPSRSPLFPYTTLFRSFWSLARQVSPSCPRAACARLSAALPVAGLRLSAFYPERPERLALLSLRIKRRKRSEEHTSELQSLAYLVCRLLLEKKKTYSCI